MSDGELRVLIVGGGEVMRRGLRDVLARDAQHRFVVMDETESAEEVPGATAAFTPGVVLLVSPPEFLLDESASLRRALRSLPTPAVVVLDALDAARAVSAIRAGARGVLLRDVSAALLRDAVAGVATGEAALDPRLAGVLFDQIADLGLRPGVSEQELDPGTLLRLSPRERDVLEALARGCRNKEIAAELGVSVGTVKTHLRHIFRKLKVADRTSAVLLALHMPVREAA